MKKRLLKRGGVFLVAALLGFSSLAVYAAEPAQEQSQEEEPAQETVQEEEPVQKQAQGTSESQYDVTKPVIEKVEFPQNGQTLTREDTVRVFVYAYDAESGIDYVQASIRLENEGISDPYLYSMNFFYDEENSCYVGEYPLADVQGSGGAVVNIRAVDQNGNYASWQHIDGTTLQMLYAFNMEPAEAPDIRVIDFQLQENGQTLKSGQSVNFTLTIEPEYTESGSVKVSFARDNLTYETTVTLSPEGRGVYAGSLYVGDYMAGAKWTLNKVYINAPGRDVPLEMEGAQNYWFEVEGIEDTENPIITSIEIDKNTETLQAGDAAKIYVQAEDNVSLNKDSGYVYMYSAADIVVPYQYIPLVYNDETDTFEGTFHITEDTYPCEWYIERVSVSDMEGNYADMTQFDPDFWQTYPFYVNVTKGTTFVSPVFDVNLSFNVLSENGYWEDVLTVSRQNIERRTTFAEAGIDIPDFQDTYPGLTQIGWKMSSGQLIDENAQIVQNMGYGVVYAVYDKIPVKLNCTYLDENGVPAYKESEEFLLFDAGTTYGDILQYMNENYTVDAGYAGVAFQGWALDGNYDLENALGSGMYLSAHAVYDKGVLNASYAYLNDQGEWSSANVPLLFEKGASYAEVMEKAKAYIPDDAAADMPIENWTYYDGMLDQPADEFGYVSFTADYGDKCVVIAGRVYYDEEGYQIVEQIPYTVDKGAKVSEIYEKLEALDMPQMYEGLRFSSWELPAAADTEVTESGKYYYLSADYANCMIRMAILEGSAVDMDGEEFAHLYCVVAEKGETITLPSSFEGFENVVWDYYPEGGTLTVQNDITIFGSLSGGITGPEQPEDPDPEQPQQPSNPGSGLDEGTELPDGAVAGVVETIANAQPGSDVQVDMEMATVVSKEILEAAKGKDVDVQLNMNGYTWTINGQDIAGSDLQDINLAVDVNANAIPNEVVRKLAGDNPTRQLSLTHEGDFGFKAMLTINVGSQYAGKYGNLFYYDSDGKMVYIDAGEVTPEGMLSITFSHASDYVVVFSDAQMSQADVPADLQPLPEESQENGGAAKTGDASQAGTTVIMMLIALVCMVAVVGTKTRKHSR